MYCSVNDSAKMTAFVNISRLIPPPQWNLGGQFVKVSVSCLITFHRLTDIYLWWNFRLNLTLEIVIDWMVLLCPCIYCTVDKNSKLEVSSGLNFFSFDFFIRLENISTSVFCWGESLLKFHFKSFQASIYWQPWKPFRASSQTPTITFACLFYKSTNLMQ